MSYTLTPWHKAVLEREKNRSTKKGLLALLAHSKINNETLSVGDFTSAQCVELNDLCNKGLVSIHSNRYKNNWAFRPTTNVNWGKVEITDEGLAKIFTESL